MNNQNNQILKACKIDSLSFASFAIKQNVDFLGIHILSEKHIGDHKELVDFIRKNNSKSIIVTKINQIELLKKLIEFYKPSGVQFHFEIEPFLVSTIRRLYPNLILIGVITNQSKYLDFNKINEIHDLLIYDTSYLGGTNETNDYNLLEYFSEGLRKKTLLAGAISPGRIKELKSLNAAGYDVQSYFRNNSDLNYRNLDKVCDIVKYPRSKMLSISLSDLPLEDIHHISSFYQSVNLEYHLDLSYGSLYSAFNTTTKSIDKKQYSLSQLPFSIHLFIKDVREIKVKIKMLAQEFPLNLIRIFVQYYDGLNLESISHDTSEIKVIPSVYYKDLPSFISKTFKTPFLSIVVPNPQDKLNIEIFFKTFLSNCQYFKNKEIWFDRNLDLDYIELLKDHLGNDFNFIIGKGVYKDWNTINKIHKNLHK